MARFDGFTPGQFSWVDLTTRDAGAALRFYEPLFGWSHIEERDERGRPYVQFTLHGLRAAGMGEMDDAIRRSGIPSVWSSYVTVKDANATAARAVELGGKLVMPPLDITSAGRMAILADPAGARFSLWQPREHAGAELVNEPNSFCWNELLSRDVDASAAFYVSLFGWTIVRTEIPNEYWEIRLGDRLNGGILPWQPRMGAMPAHWGVYFSVRDCDETVKRIEELGGQLLYGPNDIGPGRFAVVADPLGAIFQVITLHDPV